MKTCFASFNCAACVKRAECPTYQNLKQQLTPGKTLYELKVSRPELVNQPKTI